ncbi:short chain dehydrogenase [Chitinophaga sp. CF418]|nr:short chain dehydrogenase [Chitinophaga sp. CF418]
MTGQQIQDTIALNTIFPTKLTRQILPYLHSPALILNVSSYTALLPPPYLAVYAGTKAHNNAFSQSLAQELSNVGVISLLTGSVNSGSNRKPVSFMRPSAETYAKHVLKAVGCGRRVIMPYWPHLIQTFFLLRIPGALLERAMKTEMKKELNSAYGQKSE